MTDKTDSEDYSLARMYHLSCADKDILKLCQRIMISRCEAAWIWERQATYTGDELRRLTDRRIELYGQIDKDMTALEGYCLESLYTARRVLEVVVNVLGHRFMDHPLNKSRQTYLAVPAHDNNWNPQYTLLQ